MVVYSRQVILSTNMTTKPSIYVASPYGFSEAWRVFYEREYLPAIEGAGFEVIDPWVLTPQGLVDAALTLPYGLKRREKWKELNRIIGENNEQGIRRAVALVASLDGVDVDSGTATEIAFAYGLGKRILGYRGDFRLASDNDGSLVNLQVEHFIYKSGGTIATTLKEVKATLKDWAKVCASSDT